MNVTTSGFLTALRQSRLLETEQIDRLELAYSGRGDDARFLATELCNLTLLTPYQAEVILSGEGAELKLGQHILLDLLGEGGMGRVYKARHRRLKRLDAIKVIRPDRLVSKDMLKRFFREAEVIAQLSHPNIVKVFDADDDGDRHYFVMEFIDGVDLGNVLSTGPMSVGQACACIRQAALGMQHAHEKGLIHRDIKPSNLLLARHAAPAERIKVLDLGLARLREQAATTSVMTQEGQIMGTPDYMAPEQAEDATRVDVRADIYSLGCSLYQLLSNKVPFPGSSLLDKLFKHKTTMPARPDNIPDGLWAVLEKMMAKEREDRYPEPSRVALALAPFCDDEVKVAAPPARVPGSDTPRLSGMSLLPNTLDVPGANARGEFGATSPPSELAASYTPARRGSATHHMSEAVPVQEERSPPSLAPDKTAPPEPTPPKPARRLWPVLAGLALIGAGVAAALFWPRDRETLPTPVVQLPPDENKDRKTTEPVKEVAKTTKPVPPKDGTDVKPPPPPPPPPPKPDRGKEVGSVLPLVAGKPAANNAGQAGQARPAEVERVDLWAALPAQTQQLVFSRDASRAAVFAGKNIVPFDLKERKALEKLAPFELAPGVGLSAPQLLGPLALSPDGRQLVFVTLNTTERRVRNALQPLAEYDTLVRVEDGKATFYYGEEGDGKEKTQFLTRCLAFSPDGKHLVAGWPKKVALWDMKTQAEYHDRFLGLPLTGDKTSVVFAPDSKQFLLGFGDGKIYQFTTNLENDGLLAELEGLDKPVRGIAYVGKDGIVAGDASGRLCLWQTPSGRKNDPVSALEKRDGWHGKEITCLAAHGDQFATGGSDGIVQLGKREVKTPLQKFELEGPVRALAFSADGKELLAATDRKLGSIRLELPELVHARPLLPALSQPGTAKP